jgi:LysM repeat protein
MNTPNPLVPQGALERQAKGKSTVRIAIFTIVSIHAVFFAGLLMQGCRRDDGKATLKTADAAVTNLNTLPPIDSGYYSSTQDVGQASAQALSASNAMASMAAESTSSLPPAATVTELPPDTKPYTVAKGDTLAKIAKANGMTVGALSKANPSIDPGKLRPGMKIQVPAAGPASASTSPGASSAALGYSEPSKADTATTSGNVYTIKSGETLTRIAKQHGTTVKAIRAANNLKSDKVAAGQKLKMPAAHAAIAKSDTTKGAPVSKLTSTNPAHVNPISNGQ